MTEKAHRTVCRQLFRDARHCWYFSEIWNFSGSVIVCNFLCSTVLVVCCVCQLRY